MWLRRLFGKNRSPGADISEINIWRLQSLFNNFRRILYLNNAILENMAEMERALGGEYIFDRSFLEATVRTISSHVHHVTYNLNALTGNAYISLYDRYQDIRTILDDILSGNTRALACPPVLALSAVSWELEPLVGIDLVCLAELRQHSNIRVAEGFIITSQGTEVLAGSTPGLESESAHLSVDEVRTGMEEHLERLMPEHEMRRLAVVVNQIEDDEVLVKELATFSLVPTSDRSGIKIVTENSNSPQAPDSSRGNSWTRQAHEEVVLSAFSPRRTPPSLCMSAPLNRSFAQFLRDCRKPAPVPSLNMLFS